MDMDTPVRVPPSSHTVREADRSATFSWETKRLPLSEKALSDRRRLSRARACWAGSAPSRSKAVRSSCSTRASALIPFTLPCWNCSTKSTGRMRSPGCRAAKALLLLCIQAPSACRLVMSPERK